MSDAVPTPVRRRLPLTVFFPCYNEEANVERTTARALQAAARFSDDFEVIIVNDGSSDRTGELADALARQHPQVRAVHNDTNLGYGGALARGFREASKEWVFYTDGDGQFDFEEIGRLLPLLDRYDIVSAYRVDRKDSAVRKLNAWAWTWLVNLVFGMRLRDIDCAFKIFPRELFDAIEMRSTGALIDAEILAKAKNLGYRIGQVGVHHHPRIAGEQSGANLKVIGRAFVELFRLRRHIKESTGRVRRDDRGNNA
ncbi:MAG: glycosyltransferase family 2 protein [Phycisphaerae bacterium]